MKVDLNNSQSVIRTILLGLMGVLGVYLLLIITDILVEDSEPQPSPLKRVTSGKIIQWNWFGGEKAAIVTQVIQQGQSLQDAKINADLLGVMLSAQNASATLKFKGQAEKVYQVGDKLSSSLELVEIQAFRIIVLENGVRKQVLMRKPDVIMQTETVSDTSGRDVQTQGFALANMFGAVPVNVSGDTGFKINNLSTEVKMMADIRDGDVVLQVDGLSVQDLMANPVKMMSYSAANSLPVTVMRNGREETIYVNAASLSAKMLPTLGLKP